MKQALCFKNLNDFNLLAEGKIGTIDFQMVDREICEVVGSGWIQLLPYASFSYLDTEEGKLNFVAYRRPGTGDGEERLQGKFSVGFGGHIDLESEVYHSEMIKLETGEVIYKLSLEDIKSTVVACLIRELNEELGFNPFEVLQIADDNVNFGLERENEPDEVGSLHLCLSVKVNLNSERFVDFFAKAVPNAKEIENLRTMSVDVKSYISSFNIPVAAESLVSNLTSLDAESWSQLVVMSTINILVAYIQSNFSLKDTIDSIMGKAVAAEQVIRDKQAEVDAEHAALIATAEAEKAAAQVAVAGPTELIIDESTPEVISAYRDSRGTTVVDVSDVTEKSV